jgi:hypothetical protein
MPRKCTILYYVVCNGSLSSTEIESSFPKLHQLGGDEALAQKKKLLLKDFVAVLERHHYVKRGIEHLG